MIASSHGVTDPRCYEKPPRRELLSHFEIRDMEINNISIPGMTATRFYHENVLNISEGRYGEDLSKAKQVAPYDCTVILLGSNAFSRKSLAKYKKGQLSSEDMSKVAKCEAGRIVDLAKLLASPDWLNADPKAAVHVILPPSRNSFPFPDFLFGLEKSLKAMLAGVAQYPGRDAPLGPRIQFHKLDDLYDEHWQPAVHPVYGPTCHTDNTHLSPYGNWLLKRRLVGIFVRHAPKAPEPRSQSKKVTTSTAGD